MLTLPRRAAEFIRSVEAIYDDAKPETIFLGASAVQELIVVGIQEWLNEHLKSLTTNPAIDGDWATKEVVLHRDRNWLVSLTLFEAPRRYIHALPMAAIYAPLGGQALICEQYRLPERYRNDVFDPNLRVETVGQIAVAPGETLALETDRFAYYFQNPRPTAVLKLETRPIRPMEWLFSRQTLQAWQANDADLRYTQLRVAAYVLGKIAHQSSIAPLRNLSDHPHHAVRWAAIQNLGRLNRSEALVKIREAVHDPHPHVRRAAQKTLERLEGKGGR